MSLIANSLDVVQFILETKHFEFLYDGVPIAEQIGVKGAYFLFPCTLYDYVLPRLCKISGLELAACIFSCCSTLQVLDILKDFKYSLVCLSWFTV